MKAQRYCRFAALTALICALVGLAITGAQAQMDSSERAFPQSKDAIEKTLKSMSSVLSGRLPVLEGFAEAEHPLDRYERGFYQASVQITSVSRGSVVRVNVKVTAWYSDPVGARSGYQLLTSNGRLEADLLDRLAEQMAKAPTENDKRHGEGQTTATVSPPVPTHSSAATPPAATNTSTSKTNGNPVRESDSLNADSVTANPRSPFAQTLAAQDHVVPHPPADPAAGKADSQIQGEIDSLEEILKNQGHPKNLVAVKKSGTPVVATPSLNAKPVFLASTHDEFEMLDFNQDWVHVRVSGLSRGWIWRSSLEMPEGIPDTAPSSGPAQSAVSDVFHVVREETAPFPGDWQPLRGKNVKIISVQKADEQHAENSLDKLEYAKFLLDKNYSDLRAKPQELAGIVLIFDSADGGMIAATAATLQQWKSGTLTDAALWHNCFFDPPEILNAGGPSGTE